MIDLGGSRVMVTGGGGFLGRRIVAALRDRGAEPLIVRSADYDLTDPERARAALRDLTPDLVVHAAAVVGGIGANRAHPGSFFYANAVMGIHLIHEAWQAGIQKLVVVGTVCSYPKFTPSPFKESSIWDGYPEETNAPYGLAKKMLLVQGQSYRDEYGFNSVHVVPTNLYGPGDNFDPASSHVIPALIRKCIEAREAGTATIEVWGTGAASREFLHVDDAAEGIVTALEQYEDPAPLNLAAAKEISIADLAKMIIEETGFQGSVVWNTSQPDGQPRRCVDGSRAEALIGWTARRHLRDGLRDTIAWYEQERQRS